MLVQMGFTRRRKMGFALDAHLQKRPGLTSLLCPAIVYTVGGGGWDVKGKMRDGAEVEY